MTRPLNPNDPNVVILELVARRLGSDLRNKFAFVGGAVAGLLIADPANPPIRSTEDVDILSVVDGRDSLVNECAQIPQELRDYLAEQFSIFLADRRFLDALPGHLPGDAMSQSSLPDLEANIQQLANLSNP